MCQELQSVFLSLFKSRAIKGNQQFDFLDYQFLVTSSLCLFLFVCLPFSKACFCEEVLPAGYLRMLTKFAQVFAEICVALDPVSYTELLKSAGIQELVCGFPCILFYWKCLKQSVFSLTYMEMAILAQTRLTVLCQEKNPGLLKRKD